MQTTNTIELKDKINIIDINNKKILPALYYYENNLIKILLKRIRIKDIANIIISYGKIMTENYITIPLEGGELVVYPFGCYDFKIYKWLETIKENRQKELETVESMPPIIIINRVQIIDTRIYNKSTQIKIKCDYDGDLHMFTECMSKKFNVVFNWTGNNILTIFVKHYIINGEFPVYDNKSGILELRLWHMKGRQVIFKVVSFDPYPYIPYPLVY